MVAEPPPLDRRKRALVPPLLAAVVLAAGAVGPSPAADDVQPSALLDGAMAEAEAQLVAGDTSAAALSYRRALFEGWLLRGEIERLAKSYTDAAASFDKASAFASDPDFRRLLAASWLRMEDGPKAVDALSGLQETDPADAQTTRLLVMALEVSGQNDRAGKVLDAFLATAPDDPEILFAVGSEYLGLARLEDARRLFDRLLQLRPIAPTRVLIGRAYLDAGLYDRARKEFLAALAQDRTVRHAHYYLGAAIEADDSLGPDRDKAAIAEFREELALAPKLVQSMLATPGNAAASDRLGMALLNSGRPEDAEKAFEDAVHGGARALYLYHLGRCQLSLGRAGDAVVTLRRALAAADKEALPESETEKMHYELGLAARRAGSPDEAAAHLAEAKRIAERWTDSLSAGMGGPAANGKLAGRAAAVAALIQPSPASRLSPGERADLLPHVQAAMARAYLNLGTMQAQAEHLAEAAELFQEAADLDPAFPNVQYSLGVARFNLGQHERATGPLSRALAARPDDAALKRMLALAWFNSKAYDKAADLLKDDPERRTTPGLQFTYALALGRSGARAEAVRILEGLAGQGRQWPEVTEALRQLKAEGNGK